MTFAPKAFNRVDYSVEYGEFLYQTGSWIHSRRVVFRIKKPYEQVSHLYSFIVTTMTKLFSKDFFNVDSKTRNIGLKND